MLRKQRPVAHLLAFGELAREGNGQLSNVAACHLFAELLSLVQWIMHTGDPPNMIYRFPQVQRREAGRASTAFQRASLKTLKVASPTVSEPRQSTMCGPMKQAKGMS
jgi:hypothetical protein